MKTKFTKEKLELHKDDFGNNIVTDSGFFVAEFKDEKTAKLFLKAPEMFEMLVKVRQAILSEDYTRMLCESQSIKELLKEATEL